MVRRQDFIEFHAPTPCHESPEEDQVWERYRERADNAISGGQRQPCWEGNQKEHIDGDTLRRC